MLDDVQIVVVQYLVFDPVVLVGKKFREVQLLFFAKVVENRGIVRWAGVEGSLNGLRRAVFILHVVGEHHQLCDVDETTEAWIPAARDDTVALGQNPFAIVWLLHFNEEKGHTVDQQGDIGPELVITVFVGQFGDDMKAVVGEIGKVNQPDGGAFREPFIKSLAEIFIVEQEADIGQQALDIVIINAGVDPGYGGREELREDVALFIPFGTPEGEVLVTKPDQMQNAGYFDSRIFTEYHRVYNLLFLISL